MHEEIKDRLASANKHYYNLLCIFKSSCLSHEYKKHVYKLLTADPKMSVKLWQLSKKIAEYIGL